MTEENYYVSVGDKYSMARAWPTHSHNVAILAKPVQIIIETLAMLCNKMYS